MISTVCLNTNSKTFTENCIAADISELREEEGNIIWADVSDPTSRDFEELAEEFGFHHLSLRIAKKRTKAQRFKSKPVNTSSSSMKLKSSDQPTCLNYAS